MIISVHQPQYLPWLGYFDKIAKSDRFVLLDQVQYKEREFQNRNKIRARDGWIWLTVPVISKGKGRQKISEVLIDNSCAWQGKHGQNIRHSYGKAPFFKKYSEFFEKVYSKKWERLMDLNIHIIQFLLKELKINTPILYESEIGTSSLSTERIIELCQKLGADTYLSGSGGKDYLQEDMFAGAKIKLEYQGFAHPRYCQQQFQGENSFLPYMSVIDLLFNAGDKSPEIMAAL